MGCGDHQEGEGGEKKKCDEKGGRTSLCDNEREPGARFKAAKVRHRLNKSAEAKEEELFTGLQSGFPKHRSGAWAPKIQKK